MEDRRGNLENKKSVKKRNIFRSLAAQISYFFDRRSFVSKQTSCLSRYDTIDEFLMSFIGKKLLWKYLSGHKKKEDPELAQILKCYDICDEFLIYPDLSWKEEKRECLMESCPTQKWKHKFSYEFLNHWADYSSMECKLRETIIELRNGCMFKLDTHEAFENFKKELLKESKTIKRLLREIYDGL